MDPITIGLIAGGLLGQGIGAIGGASTAKEQAGVSAQIAGLEGQANEQRRKAMEIAARRDQMEVIRRTQRARSLALSSAVNQGSQSGTGLQAGLSQISSAGTANLLGINQNLEIGRNIFGIDAQISRNKMRLAELGGDAAMWQGIGSFGKSLTGASGDIGRLTGGFGKQ